MGKLDEQLIRAVVECKLAEATKLIDQGADVNTKDDSGWAPLHFAAREGHKEISRKIFKVQRYTCCCAFLHCRS